LVHSDFISLVKFSNNMLRRIIFTLSIILFVQVQDLVHAQNTLIDQDVYFDSETPFEQRDGSKEYPFKDLQNLTNILKTAKSRTRLKVYLKARSTPYWMNNNPPSHYSDTYGIQHLTITSWEPQIVLQESDCNRLPVINGTDFYFSFDKRVLHLTGLKFIQMKGRIPLYSSPEVFMSDLCLDDGASMSNKFFSINNIPIFTLQRTIVTLANGTEIISFSNGFVYQTEVKIKNITLILLDNAKKSIPEAKNEAYFRICHSLINRPGTNVSIENINFQNKSSTPLILPIIFYTSAFEIVTLKGVSLSDQTFNISRNGAFVFDEIKIVTIQNSSMINNKIYTQALSKSQDRISFFYVYKTKTLNFLDAQISNNLFNGNSTLQNNFKFLQIDEAPLFTVKNISALNNECSISTYIININNSEVNPVTFTSFQNIKIDSNKATNSSIFYLFRFSGGRITALPVNDITISNNSFSSRIFEIYTVGHATLNGQQLSDAILTHTALPFTDISVTDNENLSNFGLLSLFVGKPSSLPSDYVPDYEYYSVIMNNLTIKNNKFLKDQGTNLTDQLGVIQVAGAQLYIQNSKLIKNSFISFDFVSLFKELSSVFFMNSLVNNTNFTVGHFINTRYKPRTIANGPFFELSRAQRRVYALYRFAFVLNSNFSNMQIQEGSLFTFRNAFLLIENNNFDSIAFIQSLLVSAGKFIPPGSNINNITFARNIKVEKDSLEGLDSNLFNIYNRVAENLQSVYQKTIYFYTLRANNMRKLKIANLGLFNFQDYPSQQSLVSVMMNTFSSFEILGVATDIIKVSGSLQAFNFFNNTLNHFSGDGSILRLSSLEENKYFEFNNNTIQNNNGGSILAASGKEISSINLSFNKILDNTFSNTLFTIDMSLHSESIIFLENHLKNNTLIVSNEGLNRINSFIQVTSGASNENALFIFEKCVFIKNTYINAKKFNQYSQLNAMINLLLANSSLTIKDNIFQETQMMNEGSDMFYIATENLRVLNCNFTDTYIAGKSVFNLLSQNISFVANRFLNTLIPYGKGLFYTKSYPFLKTTVTLHFKSNHFQMISLSNEDAAHVLFIENSKFALHVTENILVDTFNLSPTFHFENVTFIDSIISHSTLQITQETVDQNFILYQVHSSSGNLKITDNIIHSNKQANSLVTFFRSQGSPDLDVILSNLIWSPNSKKNPLRLADIDSGNLLILSIIIENFVYPIPAETEEGILINVRSSKSKTLDSLNLTLNNVTFKDIACNQIAQLIGFIDSGSENLLLADFSPRPRLFELKNCSFISIKNATAASVNRLSRLDIKIQNTIFNSLSSHFGPALYFKSQTTKSKIEIQNSTFSNCRALKSGGAIYLANSHYDIQNNTFSNNIADLGGAMVLKTKEYVDLLLRQNTFIDNSAILGHNIASLPAKLIATFIFENATSFQINQHLLIRNLSRVALNISLVDDDNNISLETSNTTNRLAIITFGDQSSITTFNCTKWGCYLNSLDIILTGDSHESKSMEIQYFSSDTSKFQSKFNLTVSPCLDGSHLNPYTKTCNYCSFGTYSLTPNQSCQKCPPNAFCSGGNALIPMTGYWRSTSNKTSSEILPCRNDGVLRCNSKLEIYQNDITAQCEPGYDGVKCEECAVGHGYVEIGLLQCDKCPNDLTSLLFTIISIIVFAFIKSLFIRCLYNANSNIASEKVQEGNLESAYYVRLLLLYTQTLSLIYLFHMEIREYIGSYVHIGNPTEFLYYKFECSMKLLGIPPSDYIFGSVIFMLVSPYIQFRILKKIFKSSSSIFKLCIIYIFFSEHSGIIGFMTSFLSCSKDDPSSSPYVELHPNTKCDTTQYFIIKYFMIIPCLIILVLLVPIYALSSIFLKRNELNSPLVRLHWGVIYNIYQPKYYWWGAVSVLLMVALSVSTYLFQGDSKTYLALAFILLWIYQIAVRRAKPYQYESWNKMEATTIGLLVLNLMLCNFTTSTPVLQLKKIAYVALAIINGAMLFFILYKIRFRKIIRNENDKKDEKFPLLERVFEKEPFILKPESEDIEQAQKDSNGQDDHDTERNQRNEP